MTRISKKKWGLRALAGTALASLGLAGVAAVAHAAEWSYTGAVGTISINPTYSYDEVMVPGGVDLCGSPVPSSWRGKARLFHDDSGYDSAVKLLLAAKMAGQQVKLVVQDYDSGGGNIRCGLKRVDL